MCRCSPVGGPGVAPSSSSSWPASSSGCACSPLRRRCRMRREWLAAINGIDHPDAVLLHGAGFAGRISLLLDDRITHAGVLSGEYGCCPT
jgi:hypothetical protein